MLQSVVQPGPTDRTERQEAIGTDFLLAFCRALIRNNPSGDVIWLAMTAAEKQCPVTDEQRIALAKALSSEMGKSPWPPGFF